METQARFRDKYKLNFMLLSDPDFQAIEPYGARRLKHFMGKTALGIVRSTTLIGPDGKVRHIWESAPSKGHAAEVLEVLKNLAK